MFGLVLARPSQNKLIWFSDAVLLFVVEWRQNVEFISKKKIANYASNSGMYIKRDKMRIKRILLD